MVNNHGEVIKEILSGVKGKKHMLVTGVPGCGKVTLTTDLLKENDIPYHSIMDTSRYEGEILKEISEHKDELICIEVGNPTHYEMLKAPLDSGRVCFISNSYYLDFVFTGHLIIIGDKSQTDKLGQAFLERVKLIKVE